MFSSELKGFTFSIQLILPKFKLNHITKVGTFIRSLFDQLQQKKRSSDFVKSARTEYETRNEKLM